MDQDLAIPDSRTEVRPRAPIMARVGVDYGLLPELAGVSVKLVWVYAHGLLTREINDPGITPLRYSLLEVVGQNPGLQQVQLAEALALTRPGTSVALDFWEDRGCIERRKLATDRRSFGIFATSLGMRELERLRAVVRQADAALMSSLTEDEASQFRQLLKKIHL